MKKVLSCFLVLTMLLSLCSWGLAEAYKEYTATAQGYGGEVSVTLTLDGNRIYAVEVKGDSETQGIGSNAIDALPQAMVDSNSVVVDTFSGATFTSKAILEAAAAALAQAGLTNDDLEKAEPTETAVVHEDMTCDILVLGGGGTGLVAAVSAIENGADPARVVVVEKTGVFGGTSATAGAVLTGPLTRFMKSQDTPTQKSSGWTTGWPMLHIMWRSWAWIPGILRGHALRHTLPESVPPWTGSRTSGS